jgi:DNA-binding NtrC family response regulator
MRNALVIVKNDSLRHEIRKTLARLGLGVAVTADGQKGLALLRTNTFDLVVADMLVKAGNGVEVAREIATRSPKQPVIAVSGSSLTASEMYQTLVGEVGVNGFLVAPFDAKSLSQMARQVIMHKTENAIEERPWKTVAPAPELPHRHWLPSFFGWNHVTCS